MLSSLLGDHRPHWQLQPVSCSRHHEHAVVVLGYVAFNRMYANAVFTLPLGTMGQCVPVGSSDPALGRKGPSIMALAFSRFGDLAVSDTGQQCVVVYGPDRSMIHVTGLAARPASAPRPERAPGGAWKCSPLPDLGKPQGVTFSSAGGMMILHKKGAVFYCGAPRDLEFIYAVDRGLCLAFD